VVNTRAATGHFLEIHTMSVIRVGSTGKYADGWDHIFGGTKPARGKAAGAKAAAAKAAKKPASKASAAKKAAGKKAAKRK
jgi:hypothetical protein